MRPTIARTRSTASPSSSPAAWAWQVSKQKPTSTSVFAFATAFQSLARASKRRPTAFFAAGGVLDVDRDLRLEHLERARPAADSFGDPVLGVARRGR